MQKNPTELVLDNNNIKQQQQQKSVQVTFKEYALCRKGKGRPGFYTTVTHNRLEPDVNSWEG